MLFSIICIALIYGSAQACPPQNLIAPCDCKTFLGSVIMSCEGLLNPDELIKPIVAVAEKRSPVEVLTITNSTLMYIPNSIFKFTKFQKVHFINSEVMSLSDTDLAFEGLENSLRELRAQQASYVASWDWKQLRNLKELQLIDVVDIDFGSVSAKFPDLKKLKFLGIIHAGIDFIINYAFADLKELTVLNLKGNEINELNRNMFPEPAYNLISMDFSNNQLSYLPKDIFRNMPSLAQVVLDYNKFTTLDRNVFTWALKNLSELGMFGNKFVCDCRIKWMAGGQVPVVFTGACDAPANLKGKQLRLLQLEEANCNKFVCDCRIKWMAGGQVPVVFTGACDAPANLKGKQLRLLQLEEANC